jgi:alkyl sulfatase BDS1-like metallo-beta-lactamase superfamily hydrolase
MSSEQKTVYMGAPVDVGVGPRGEVANKAYSEFSKQFARKVHEVAPGVWCHVGSCLGNSTAIQGKTGLIVVDTGDCIEQARMHQEDFAKVTGIQASALIYTHSHYIYGSRAWVPQERETEVEVWAHPDLTQNMLRIVSDLSPTFVRRAAIQFGMFLPRDGEDAMSHQGLGPFVFEFDKYQPTTGFVRPNKLAADGQEAVIDGVKVQFFHAWGDTDDTLLIWLPESRTVINNVAWPAMFNIYTLRGDLYRNPVELLRGLDKILELAPEHMVGVHGVPLNGREAIQKAVIEYRDTIQFTYDQTIRGINAGMGPDELVRFVKLPPALANGRLTGQFYGELPYHVRQIYAGMMGWFGRDTSDLHPPSVADQAARTVALAGGPEKVAQAVRDAQAKREFAWAAKMAGWLVDGGFDTPEHRQLKADALRAMGQVTTAANTRSWYLTQARELEGKADTRVPPFRFVNPGMVRQMPPLTYVNGLRFQLPPELSANGPRTIVLRFNQPDAAYTLRLRNGVVQIEKADTAQADATLEMPFDAWARLIGRETKGQALVDAGDIKTSGAPDLIQAVLAIGG